MKDTLTFMTSVLAVMGMITYVGAALFLLK